VIEYAKKMGKIRDFKPNYLEIEHQLN